jgi:hypothetical protein
VHKRIGGWLLILAGIPTGAIGLLCLTRVGFLPWASAFVASLVGFGIVSIASVLIRYGRGLLTPTAADAIADDNRPPMLLLRAFADDKVLFRSSNPALAGSDNTLEELLQRVASTSGPVVTIGRPGEILPPPGASREWVSDDVWRQRVSSWLDQCQGVLMIMGRLGTQDSGLHWEIEQLRKLADPTKIVLVLPPVLPPELRYRWEAYREAFGFRLPEFAGDEVAATFDADWNGVVARSAKRDIGSYESAVHLVLPLGVAYADTPTQRNRHIAMIIGAIIGGSCAGAVAWLLVMAVRSFPNDPFDFANAITVIAAAMLGGVLFGRMASRKLRV